jgi:IclR family transcriptional regulator, KDG regulon repressor
VTQRLTVGRTPRKNGDYSIGVLTKALDVLDLLEVEQPITLSEIGRRSGVSKPTAFRILANLEARGYVEREEASGQYRLGIRLVQLGALTTRSLDLRTFARPALERLHRTYDETVNLAVVSERGVVYIDILESAHGLRMAATVGALDDFHSTALGKAALAFSPPETLQSLLSGRRLPRKTPNTIVRQEALARELDETRRRGYAIDEEENELGARCVGAPVFDQAGRVVAAVSVSGPASRLTLQRVPAVAADLLAASREISVRLGYRPAKQAGR